MTEKKVATVSHEVTCINENNLPSCGYQVRAVRYRFSHEWCVEYREYPDGKFKYMGKFKKEKDSFEGIKLFIRAYEEAYERATGNKS